MEKFYNELKWNWVRDISLTLLSTVFAVLIVKYEIAHLPHIGVKSSLSLIGLCIVSVVSGAASIKSYPFRKPVRISSASLKKLAEAIDGQPCELIYISEPYKGYESMENECLRDIIFRIDDRELKVTKVAMTRIDKTITDKFCFNANRLVLIAI